MSIKCNPNLLYILCNNWYVYLYVGLYGVKVRLVAYIEFNLCVFDPFQLFMSSLAFKLFSPTRSINSIKREHSCPLSSIHFALTCAVEMSISKLHNLDSSLVCLFSSCLYLVH